MGSPAIFAGNFVKFLKTNLNLDGKAYVLTSPNDPRSVATTAPSGSLLLRQNDPYGELFVKRDNGLSTNWDLMSVGGPVLGTVHVAYVSPNADPAIADGTIARPFQTIAAGITAAAGVETLLLLMPGTYSESAIALTHTQPIVLYGLAGREKTIISNAVSLDATDFNGFGGAVNGLFTAYGVTFASTLTLSTGFNPFGVSGRYNLFDCIVTGAFQTTCFASDQDIVGTFVDTWFKSTIADNIGTSNYHNCQATGAADISASNRPKTANIFGTRFENNLTVTESSGWAMTLSLFCSSVAGTLHLTADNAPMTVNADPMSLGNLTTTINFGGSFVWSGYGLNVQGHVKPLTDNTFDLGSAPLRWRSLHVGPGSVVVHNDKTNTNYAKLAFNGAVGQLVTDAATPLQMATGANAGVYVDTAGKVGVGNLTPQAPLHVSLSTTVNIPGDSFGTMHVDGLNQTFFGTSANLTVQTTDAQAADVGGSIGLGGRYLASSNQGVVYSMLRGAKENGASNDTSGYLAFGTRPNAPIVERMRITSTGKVGINTSTPLSQFDVAGGVAIGTYAGANAAPANGLIVSGLVGIGTNAPVTGAALTVNLTNTDLTNTAGANSHTTFVNPSATGQTALSFVTNGSLVGKIRSKFNGDMNWVSGAGDHVFYTGGDFGVGGQVFIIKNNGNVGIGGNPGTTFALNIGTGNPTTATAGMQFGSAADVPLYRSAAATLRTDASFSVGGNLFVQGLSASKAIPYAGVDGNLYSSTTSMWWDGHKENFNAEAIVAGSNQVQYLLVGLNSGGLAVSTNNGTSFTNLNTGSLIEGVFADGPRFYAGSVSNGLYVSNDHGQTWAHIFTSANTGLSDNEIRNVYAQGSNIYVTGNGGFAFSKNDGATWTTKTTANGLGSNTTVDVVVVNGIIYVGTTGGLSISTDGGATFTNHTSMSSVFIIQVKVFNGVIYISEAGSSPGLDKLERSTDGGNTWTTLFTVGGGQNINSFDVLNNVIVFNDNTGTIHRSTDAGATWTNGLGVTANGNVRLYQNGGGTGLSGVTVYAADFSNNAIRVSTNGGTSWVSTTVTGPRGVDVQAGNSGIDYSGQPAFNGVSYRMPSSNGAAGTFLQTDGFGNLTWASSSGSLASLSDVNVTSPAPVQGAFLQWDSGTSKWVPESTLGAVRTSYGGTRTYYSTLSAALAAVVAGDHIYWSGTTNYTVGGGGITIAGDFTLEFASERFGLAGSIDASSGGPVNFGANVKTINVVVATNNSNGLIHFSGDGSRHIGLVSVNPFGGGHSTTPFIIDPGVKNVTAFCKFISAGTGNTADKYLSFAAGDGANNNVQVTTETGSVWTTTDRNIAVKTSAYASFNFDDIFANTTGGAFTVTLPASPYAGWKVRISDYAGTWGTNNVTVARNGQNINGVASNFILNVSNAWAEFVFVDSTQGWRVLS